MLVLLKVIDDRAVVYHWGVCLTAAKLIQEPDYESSKLCNAPPYGNDVVLCPQNEGFV